MKKYILIIAAVFAAALLVPGCYPNENVELNTKGLTISLFSDEPETKADPTPETKITHFDYFFFKDANGTQLVDVDMQGRADGSSKTFETGIGKDFVKLRRVTSYVYIIANYPEELDHTQAWTLEQLKALEFESKLVKAVDEETGAVTFFTDMVMDSFNKTSNTYTTELTPALVDEARTVSIGLTRIASKLVLNFTIPASIAGSMTGENEAWTPVLKDLRAYYVNALNNLSTVSATPVKRSAIPETAVSSYEYLSYPTNYPISPDPLTATPTDGKYKFNTGEVYTYPQTWTAGENGEPYFKIQMTWYSNVRGTANFYYKICVPKPATDGTVTIDRNTCYVVDVALDVIDTENEYVVINPANYTVHEWAINAWKGGSGNASARFFNVPRTEYELFTGDPLDIPYLSSSAVTATFEEISYFYYGDTHGSTINHVFHEDAFNKTTQDGVTVVTLKNTDSNGHAVVAAARESNTYNLSVVGKNVRFEHALTKVYTQRVTKVRISNVEGKSAVVTIIQHPAIEIKKNATKNAFVNGWFGRASADVKDNNGNLMGVDFTPTTYGGLPNPAYHTTDQWNTSSKYVSINDATHGNLGTVYGSGSSSVQVSSIFTVEIKITAFDEGNDSFKINYVEGENYNSATPHEETRHYKIGDPRVPVETYFNSSQLNIPQYLRSDRTHRGGDNLSANQYGSWDEPIKALMADQGVDANEVIAPHFLVSSQFNVLNAALTHNNSARRAITYQENGYPAGRWRLPTEAEVAFIIARQKDGTIPWLFADTYYHCANGRMFYVDMRAGHQNDNPISCKHTSGYNRFVYDLWYWGDDPTDGVTENDNMTDWEKAMSEDGVTPNWKAHWAEYYHPNMHKKQ